jgi:hypothetical protein
MLENFYLPISEVEAESFETETVASGNALWLYGIHN